MKWFIALLIGFQSVCCFSLLSEPYCDVNPVLPFDGHSFYGNASQLKSLINKHKIKTIIEVGSWLGASTRHLASCLPKEGRVHAIDHWKGSVEHQPGQSFWHPALPNLYEQFLSNVIHARLTDKIIPHRMDSLTAARVLSVMADLIYIDASHDTDSVYQDLQAWLPHLNPKGILCGDDWSWNSVRIAVERFALENRFQIEATKNFYRLIRS